MAAQRLSTPTTSAANPANSPSTLASNVTSAASTASPSGRTASPVPPALRIARARYSPPTPSSAPPTPRACRAWTCARRSTTPSPRCRPSWRPTSRPSGSSARRRVRPAGLPRAPWRASGRTRRARGSRPPSRGRSSAAPPGSVRGRTPLLGRPRSAVTSTRHGSCSALRCCTPSPTYPHPVTQSSSDLHWI
ncbi:hypothetical protein DFJ74DRAFT_681978 [Hyaloraphidium curvatum]|nr:hypothetical protein DFJ74DRAFT_681978 [Hyaloraphidium curvatum]